MFLAVSAGPAVHGAQFSSGVSLVEVYATVLDVQQQPVQGLTRDDFIVEEDGAPQQISAFAAGDFPLSVAIGIDRSFSVPRAQLSASVTAVSRLLNELRPEDETMVLAIGSQTEVLAPLSRDRAAAASALHSLATWGTTPLFDASLQAIEAIQPASGRRALILVSDGTDRYSEKTAADVLKAAREKDVLIYPIGTGKTRPPIFAEMAAASGGRSFHAPDAHTLSTALTTIAQELRSQYLLGYTPSVSAEQRPGWRAIRVSVRPPGATVRARDGYVAH
jgi:Ca-activated chloride channel family protein